MAWTTPKTWVTGELATASDLNTYIRDNQNAIFSGQIKQFIPSAAIIPTTSNGCAGLTTRETTSGKPDLHYLAFDGASDEHAQFSYALPAAWNLGNLTFRVHWSTDHTGTSGIAMFLKAVSVSDGDTADVNFGTAVSVEDNAQSAAEDVLISAESADITPAGSPADNELTFFDIYRDISDAADTMGSNDLWLLGVDLLFTLDQLYETV